MSAGVFILILVVAIAALVLMIVKAKMHPVLALFIAALGTGIALGYGVTGSVDYISNGFGGTLGSVGITIILGAIISMAIEDTGAAKVIANFFIKLFRGKRMELAPSLTAFIMSIPVFGDITMVLTAPIASMLSKRKHISMSTMASFTGLGLFLTHGLVPPTPGILAIALMFGSDLGMTIVWGLVISFVGFFGTYFLLRKWTEKEWIEPNPEFVRGMEETDSDSVDDILIKDPGLPHTGEGFLPLLLPVLLISVSSFAQMYAAEGSAIYTICTTIGNKVIALSIGLLYSFYLGYKQRKMVLGVYADTYNEPKAKLGEVMLNKWVARGLVVCLSPLLITAMGGAFGNVLKNSPALEPLSKLIADSPIPAILVPWAIAAIMMTSVGSMTTAGMTAAAIVLPMMPDLGLSSLAAVLAITAVAVGDVHSLLSLGEEAIYNMETLGDVLLPAVSMATAASGSPAMAVVKHGATILFSDFLLRLIHSLLIPLCYAFVAANVAWAALANEGLKRLAGFLKWLITMVLSVVLLVFVGYLNLSGVISGGADAATVKAAKFTLSNLVPVVGGVISDTAETLLAGAAILRNAAGVFGMLAVLGICVAPFLNLGAHYLLYKGTAALAATAAGSGRLTGLIEALGTAFGLILAMTASCAVLLTVAMVSAVSAVG